MLRIRRAFCVELSRSVSIDEARLAFALGDQKVDAYRFVCAEPACQDRNVRISGVNYRVDAVTGRKILENHFRRWDLHFPGCMYAEGEKDLSEIELHRGSGGVQGHMTPLESDLVAIYNPGGPDKKSADDERARNDGTSSGSVVLAKEVLRGDHYPHGARLRYATELGELVDTYREARLRLDRSELQKRMLRIVGHGSLSIGDLFVPVRRARFTDRLRVLYGGAVLWKQYPRGFRLRFFDRVDGLPVFVYVPGESLRDSPAAVEILVRVRAMHKGEYSITYVFGGLEAKPDGRSFSCVVRDLRHLVLRVPGRGLSAGSSDPVSPETSDAPGSVPLNDPGGA